MNVDDPVLTERSVGFFLNVLAMFSMMLRLWRRERQIPTCSGIPRIYKYISDIFIIIAYVLAIGNSIIAWPRIRQSSDGVECLDSDFEFLLLIKYLSDPLYTLSNGAAKVSITFFVLGQLDKRDPARSDLVKVLRGAVFWTIAFTMLLALQCHPLQKAWMTDVEGICISSTLIHIIQMMSSMYLDGCLLGIAVLSMSWLFQTEPLEMAIILFTGLIVLASDIYSNFMASTWMDGLVRGTSYEGLTWPAMDLFARVVFANTPFLYSAYMGDPAMNNSA